MQQPLALNSPLSIAVGNRYSMQTENGVTSCFLYLDAIDQHRRQQFRRPLRVVLDRGTQYHTHTVSRHEPDLVLRTGARRLIASILISGSARMCHKNLRQRSGSLILGKMFHNTHSDL